MVDIFSATVVLVRVAALYILISVTFFRTDRRGIH